MKKIFVLLFVGLFAWTGFAHAAEIPEFILTTTADTTKFSFVISAVGTFEIDWGDGDIETINKTDTTETTYSHDYSAAAAYTIGISGQATAYTTLYQTAAISFEGNRNVAGISGSLGAIFGTLDIETNNQPQFDCTFRNCSNLTGSIPENLFSGISGAPAMFMFHLTFDDCSGLTGSIPENLFSGIQGVAASATFSGTFSGCSGLTGGIPENLFSGISGHAGSGVFGSTFYGCSGLTGSIPAGLFRGISGSATMMSFDRTFYNCSGLSGYVPGDLFNFTCDSDSCNSTFNGATGLDTVCPAGTYNDNRTGNTFSVALCSPCPAGTVSSADSADVSACTACGAGLLPSVAGVCASPCGAGITTLNTSTGVSVPLFADKNTSPAIHIRQNDTVCYADLVAGKTSNEILVHYNGTVYHTVKKQ